MFEKISLKSFQDEKWEAENEYENFAWFHKKDGGKDESFRLDIDVFDEENKKVECHILSLSTSRKFEREWMELIHKIIGLLPKDMDVKITKSTPQKEAWRIPTNFNYMWIPVLLFNLFLYVLVLKFVPKGESVSVLFLLFSIPFGYILSSTHHWGAGAPFAGFEKMIKVMRWKYAWLNFCWSLFALTIVSVALNGIR